MVYSAITMHWRVGLVCCLLTPACSDRQVAVTDPVTTTATTGQEVVEFGDGQPLELIAIEPQPGTLPLTLDCSSGQEESCNALDDDCDDAIDEGCGYGGGSIQVTAGWNTGSDIDLYVIDPLGDTISFQRATSPSGGRMDQLGRGNCASSVPNPRIENARWINQRPPTGEYVVVLRYWGECVTGGGPTAVVISVAVDRKVRGQFLSELVPNQRETVLRFRVR